MSPKRQIQVIPLQLLLPQIGHGVIEMITDSEIIWLKKFYPELIPGDDLFSINGQLNFTGSYNEALNKFQILYSRTDNTIEGIVLQGTYQIRIEFRNKPNILCLPKLFLEEGQIEMSSTRHFNPIDKSACLCGPIEASLFLANGLSLNNFIEQLVVPFLYEQTFYDKYSKKWPWGEYGHGAVGTLESFNKNYYVENATEICLQSLKSDSSLWILVKRLLLQKGYIKGHFPCLCGSTNHIRRCHPEAWEGINRLKGELQKLSVKIN